MDQCNCFEWFVKPDNEAKPRIRYWLPQAMENAEGIRADVKDLKERGFGGIEVVPFRAAIPDETYAWNSERWYRNLECLIQEAQVEDMKVDIANGPAWPIASPNLKDADEEGTLYELTYGYTIVDGTFDHAIPERRVSHDEGTSRLIALMAYEILEDKILKQDSCIDLLPYVKDHRIDHDLAEDRKFIIFAFYEQPSVQKVMEQYYVIDHFSKKGADACISYWNEKLYPLIRKYPGVCESIFCDSLEYKVSLEWTRGFPDLFKEKKGYDLLPYLPLLQVGKTYPQDDAPGFSFEDPSVSQKISHDYCDVLTDLYIHEHLQPLDAYAKSIGMTLRYQVSYNKPLNIENSARAVSIPENETLNRASINNLAAMNGAVHVGNKKIYSYECNAEFMNVYGQSYADLLWWTKRAYIAGINRQVYHGAAYNGGYGEDHYFEWPGYEAFGRFVSNYWNRTLNVKHAKHHMDYVARINEVMQKEHVSDLAIYRHKYLNDGKGGDGEYIIHDDRLLMDHGYSYDFLSPELLRESIGQDAFSYKALIINDERSLTEDVLDDLLHLSMKKVPVYFLGSIPSVTMFYKENEERLQAGLKQLFSFENVKHVSGYEDLIKEMHTDHVDPDISYDASGIASVHCKDENMEYYYLYNYNPVESCITTEGKYTFKQETVYPSIDKAKVLQEKDVVVKIKGEGIPVCLDAEDGSIQKIRYQKDGTSVIIPLHFLKEEAKLLALVKEDIYETLDVREMMNGEPDCVKDDFDWDVSFFKLEQNGPLFRDASYQMIAQRQEKGECVWWDEMDPALSCFAGYAIYETEFDLHKEEDAFYVLRLCEISDTFDVTINDRKIYSISQYQKDIDLTDALKEGTNILRITVFSNLARMLVEKTNAHYGMHGVIRLMKN